jgi:hypothetical protein
MEKILPGESRQLFVAGRQARLIEAKIRRSGERKQTKSKPHKRCVYAAFVLLGV